jgi:pyruvate dehydrogenase E2 component (dihydrolipoamide acetyltransferase)
LLHVRNKTKKKKKKLNIFFFSSLVPEHSIMGLPALSPTMEKGNLVKWLKKEG